MHTLSIRNLPENIHSALSLQAAQDGLSLEAEARKILAEACKINIKPATGLQDLVEQLYKGKNLPRLSNNCLKNGG